MLAQWVAQSRLTISRIHCEDNFEACVLQLGKAIAPELQNADDRLAAQSDIPPDAPPAA